MTKKIGIFINNTDSIIKYKININNYNNLKQNFTIIIIIDINTKYSNNLKSYIEKDTEYFIYYFILEKNCSFIEKIQYIYDNINFSSLEYKYLTFIEDNYIYLDSFKKYFTYVNDHNLDACPYYDSSEKDYHYGVFLYSINKKTSLKFSDYIKTNIINDDYINYINYINLFFNSIKNIKIKSFLKIAYVDCNIGYNIFKNIEYLEFLVENNFISLISLETIEFIKNDYTFYEYTNIPNDFDINIYKEYDDLSTYSESFLHNHFLKHGQFEFRKFKKNIYDDKINTNYILPNFIRKKLHNLNILYYFDLPYEFNIFNYKNINHDLSKFTINELILHWVNNGIYENRKY